MPKLAPKVKKTILILVALCAMFTLFCYGATLLFFMMNNLPLECARPFNIFDYWVAYQHSPKRSIRFSLTLCFILPFAGMAFIGFLALLGKNQRALHGDARFATMAEVKKVGLIEPKNGLDKTILVGKFKDNYLTYSGYQFVMLAAPTRSGKGVGVVIPNCLNYSDSLVVLDIKFENFDITSGFRKQHGQEVYLFAPFGRFNENKPIEEQEFKTHRWNPLDYISTDPAARIQDIDAIATALYSTTNEKDAFWSDMAKDLFRGLCLMVLETEGLQHTLGEILRQASGKGKPLAEHVRDMINTAEENGKPYSNACIDALNRIITSSDNTLNNILNTFNAKLLTFANPRVDAATSASDFDLRQVRRKKMTIYIGIRPSDLGQAAFIINLFFDQLINLNTRTLPQQDPTLKYQCLMIMDEFTSIGKVEMIHKSISYQAGFNMRVLTIIQNKSQLEDVYTKSGAITLMSNHALMIMYAPSPVVQSDANEYSEMLGYQTVKSKSKSKQHGKAFSNSCSESDQRRALMLPQEIKELGVENEIVSLENCKPILCKKIKYYEDPNFTCRCNLPVAEVSTVDMDLFMSKIEDRRRDLTDDDISESFDANKIVSSENFIKPTRMQLDDLSDEDYADLVEDVAQNMADAVLNPSIDKASVTMDENEANTAVNSLFSENSDDDFLFEEPANTASSNDESKSDEEVMNLLEQFGFDDSEEASDTKTAI